MSLNLRKLVAALATASAATLMVSCSATPTAPITSGSPAASPDATAGTDPVTLEMSWWGDENRAALFDEVISLFEAKYPNITVTRTPVGSPDDLFNRLATDFGAGGSTAPDVFALGGAKPQEYGAAGALLDLGTVADIVQSSKYPDFSLTNAIVDGTLYGLPTGGNATAMFVNTDILEKAGLAMPEGDWTWDQFKEIANAVGSKGLKNDQGQPVWGIDLRVQDIIGTYTGQETEFGMYDWDGNVAVSPEVLAQWYQLELDLMKGGGLPDADVLAAGWALTPDQQPFTLGQAAITFGYSNLASAYASAGNIALLKPPTNTQKTGVALLPSAFWSINASTQHPTEAAMLVNWFLNEPEAAALIKDTRGVQFNKEIAETVAAGLEGPNKAAADYV
ncbi:MAG: extracellular solute-binding protein, partial [Propionibacteriaceae bacterium]|nr:extracellular solute-binding protein [Propionibacteriaceae bacterium]